MTVEIDGKRCGRPRLIFTEEERKAYRKKYNDLRPPYVAVYKTCEICNKVIYGTNLATHKKSKGHKYLAEIAMLKSQLDI